MKERGSEVKILKHKVKRYRPDRGALIVVALLLLVSFTGTIVHAASVDSRLREARQKAVAKDYRGAIALYDKLLSDDGGNREALKGKARTLSWMGHYNEAREIYRKVLKMAPDDIEAITGIADTYAWQKQYYRAIKLLETSLKKYPDRRELLIRLARYHLWSHNKKEALSYTDRVIANHPDDKEALKLRGQGGSLSDWEAAFGYSYLDINNNVDGQNFHGGLEYHVSESDLLFGRAEHLYRFNEKEIRVTVGGVVTITEKLQFSGEIGLSPDAVVFPRFSGWVELASPVTPTLVLYGNMSYSHYAVSNLYGFSLAGEYYPIGQLAILSRFTLSHTNFDSGGNATNSGYFVKTTWFFNDKDKLFAYFSYGSEAYKVETFDRTGDVESTVYGAGGTYFFSPATGVTPTVEFQDREGGTEYLQGSLEIHYRW